MKRIHFYYFLLVVFFIGCAHNQIIKSQMQWADKRKISSEDVGSFENVETVFNFRCIACHSCTESPCQLNLQSFDGITRGIHSENVYGTNRLKPTAPKRLSEDAHSIQDWRKLGFADVIGNSQHSVLLKVLELGQSDERTRVTRPVRDSQMCISQQSPQSALQLTTQIAMPYGLPPISKADFEVIKKWVDAGAPGPKVQPDLNTSNESRQQVERWNSFFNQEGLKAKISSRYLYEHLFLAHLYFDHAPREFYKLIRSSTSCERPSQIATRTPNSDPKTDRLFYCLVRDHKAIVAKNHMPYKLDETRYDWLQKNFIEGNWRATEFPSYLPEIATNPFRAFREIPIKTRYEFLLQDARYHIMTFIKGPVCNGSVALSSIQEQFFVFFMNPESDLMVRSPEYAKSFESASDLPGQWGDIPILTRSIPAYAQILRKRNAYREAQNVWIGKLYPRGLGLQDIWDGEGRNRNASLTVFRHDDNAAVLYGVQGDLAKTVFVLDYSTFERLSYNLVVNFDVYGGLGHQYLTRLYMDLIRMDSENNYLNFLPPENRTNTKDEWYKGLLTQVKLHTLNEKHFPEIPSAVQFEAAKGNYHLQMVQKILFERLSPQVRGPDDEINWKQIKRVSQSDKISAALSQISSIQARKMPFSNFFPEVSYLFVGDEIYSILRHREHTNLSWVANEEARLSPEQDSLTIGKGFYGFSPNRFFYVDPDMISQFVKQVQAIRTEEQYEQLLYRFGVDRFDARMWYLYDKSIQYYNQTDRIESGFIDLSRYDL